MRHFLFCFFSEWQCSFTRSCWKVEIVFFSPGLFFFLEGGVPRGHGNVHRAALYRFSVLKWKFLEGGGGIEYPLKMRSPPLPQKDATLPRSISHNKAHGPKKNQIQTILG